MRFVFVHYYRYIGTCNKQNPSIVQQEDIFKIRHNNTNPRKGRILISEPFLRDSFFQRAVVFLIDHTSDGSMGFVINKRTDLIVNTFFPELSEQPDLPIYLGGPVSSNHLFFLHSLGETIVPGAVRVKDDLYFGGDFESLKYYIYQGGPIEGKVKFFLGYSGWSEDQLLRELEADSWLVASSNKDILIADGESYWKDAIKLLGDQYKTWTNFPKNPEFN